MQRIGLTGGIGSGKSTVASILQGFGATIVDSDAISRSLTAPGGIAIPAIAQAFGSEMIDSQGALNRAAMRAEVFADFSAKRRLEAILHPLIGAECERQAAGAPSDTVVFDIPLLVESGRWRRILDRVLVVDAMEVTQVNRVMVRSAWNRASVQAVIHGQASRLARRAAADAVIFNDGVSQEELAAQLKALWMRWRVAGLR